MPAPPELGNSAGNIGIVEVLHKLESKHPSQPDGHVGISAEIKIDLQRIGDNSNPCCQDRKASDLHSLHRGVNHAEIVGEQHLFRQPFDEKLRPQSEARQCDAALLELRFDIRITDNRPGNELREHGDIQAEADEVFLYLDLAPIDVEDIGEGLKGIKRDSDGERQLLIGNTAVKNLVDRINQKAGIFEKAEQEQIDKDSEQKAVPRGFWVEAFAVDVDSHDIVKRRGEKH